MATLRVGGQRRYVYGKTRHEAASKLRELQQQAAKGSLTTPSRITVREYLDQWLITVTPRLRAGTVAQHEILARVHITPTLGAVKLAALRPIQLQQLYSRILAQGREALGLRWSDVDWDGGTVL